MALKLRRGTDAERQLITPEAGEPLWIDNQALWIGDGSTVGGIKVTGGLANDLAAISVDALSDVDTTSITPITGDALVWDGANFVPDVPAITLDDLINVDVTSNPPSNGDSLIWNGATWEPGTPTFGAGGVINGYLDGDMEGSVFSDGSVLLVDAVREKIVGDIDTQDFRLERDGNNIVFFRAFTNTTGGANDIAVYSHRDTTAAPTALTMGDGIFDLVGLGYQGTTYHPATFIRFRTDNDGTPTGDMNDPIAGIPGSILFTVFDDSGIQNLPGTFELNQTGLLVGSATNPNNDQMRVGGNVSASGAIAPGVYADATARDAAITSPYEGMLVFLQDTQKFSGYVSDTGIARTGTPNSTPGWVDLVSI